MKEFHFFSLNSSQKFVTINVVEGPNPSGAWPAAGPVLLKCVLMGPSGQRRKPRVLLDESVLLLQSREEEETDCGS